jgi:hypothetical protein
VNQVWAERRLALATIVVIHVRPVGAFVGVVQFRLCRTASRRLLSLHYKPDADEDRNGKRAGAKLLTHGFSSEAPGSLLKVRPHAGTMHDGKLVAMTVINFVE